MAVVDVGLHPRRLDAGNRPTDRRGAARHAGTFDGAPRCAWAVPVTVNPANISLRARAFDLHEAGHMPKQISDILGVCHRVVKNWLDGAHPVKVYDLAPRCCLRCRSTFKPGVITLTEHKWDATISPIFAQAHCAKVREAEMAQKVTLDAMIRREDFAREMEGTAAPRIGTELKLGDLLPTSAIRRQLRKPEFQRETNYWSPAQVLKFLTSFVDGGVIPSIILWRSTNFVFVIDGAHRLSALCAWIADDYGDGTESKNFFSDNLLTEQKRIAARMRSMVDRNIGKYAELDKLVGKVAADKAGIRAGAMNTRPIIVQTVDGNAQVAEDSFFAINTQGTTLDETEQYLIRNRRKPVAIGARAI
ncbi:MAG: DUF262 domain-containing protein, partial [Bradyrhizobium sp.]|nr:DUF262 domain-containing protein [Bradyrhizobium sp.]